jgi:hypothetical protein
MPVRDVSDSEVVFYQEHGWVKLDGLVDRETVAALLDAGRDLTRRCEAGWDAATPVESFAPGKRDYGEWWAMGGEDGGWTIEQIETDPFSSFKLSRDLGRVAHRLVNRSRLTDDQVAIRRGELDALICMMPSVEPRAAGGYHQDGAANERSGALMVWLALDEVVPEQGAMRFLSGSHREGSLGSYSFDEITGGRGVLDRYPKLQDIYEWSPPFHYRPGDATVHSAYLIHGTPANRTDKPRWSYIIRYDPADLVSDDPGPLVYP